MYIAIGESCHHMMPFTIVEFTGVGCKMITTRRIESQLAIEKHQVITIGSGDHFPTPGRVCLDPHRYRGLRPGLAVQIQPAHGHLGAAEIRRLANLTVIIGMHCPTLRRHIAIIEIHLAGQSSIGRGKACIIHCLWRAIFDNILHIDSESLNAAAAIGRNCLDMDFVRIRAFEVELTPVTYRDHTCFGIHGKRPVYNRVTIGIDNRVSDGITIDIGCMDGDANLRTIGSILDNGVLGIVGIHCHADTIIFPFYL